MKPYNPVAPTPEALTWRPLVSTGVAVVSLTAYGLIAGAILGADDPQVAAKLAGRGLENFGFAAIFSGLGALLWWWAAEQKLGYGRSLTVVAAAIMTIMGCVWFGDGLIVGSRAVDAYLSNPALVHGPG